MKVPYGYLGINNRKVFRDDSEIDSSLFQCWAGAKSITDVEAGISCWHVRRELARMSIRDFKECDFSLVAEIYSLSKLDELRYEDGRFELLPLEQDGKRFRELIESKIFVYDDGGILGYGAVFGSEIRALFVHPLFRGRGIGRRLLEHLMANTGTLAKLYVAKNNAPAIALYRKFGFVVTREFETFYNRIPVLANEMVRKESSGC